MATAKDLMDDAHQKLVAQKDAALSIGAVYKFILSGDAGGTWIMNLKDDVGVTEGDGDAGCTISMDAADYVDMREGRSDPQQLFFQGKLQVDGDIGLAMKLQSLTEVLS
jgi:predicted lipid carrier protein YhbT